MIQTESDQRVCNQPVGFDGLMAKLTYPVRALLHPRERGIELRLVTYMAPLRTIARGQLGSVNARLGDVPAAEAGWDESLAEARASGDRYGEAMTLWARARTHARQSTPDWTAALSDLDAALALLEPMEARPSVARALRDRAEVLRGVGRGGEADAAEQRSREIGKELGLKDFS